MAFNKSLVFLAASISCLIFAFLVESTRTIPFLTPEPQPSSLSPEPQPPKDRGVLQVYGDVIKQDIELIRDRFQGVFKSDKDIEFLPNDAQIPEACMKPCAKAYASIINDLKKADADLGATKFKFVSEINEDYDSFSTNIAACEQCIDREGNNGNAVPLKTMNRQLKKDALEWLSSIQFVGF